MLVINWHDDTGFRRFERAIRSLDPAKLNPALNRAVNRAGDMSRTQVRRVLPGQTGLPRATIVKAVRVIRSQPFTLAYTMTAQGGDVALKFFGARETRKGVSAAPFGKRQVFAGTFIRGGRFPNRSGTVFHGHVMERTGPARFPIKVVKSGVVIPTEMVSGETARAFQSTVSRVLPHRVAHEIRRLTGGVIS